MTQGEGVWSVLACNGYGETNFYDASGKFVELAIPSCRPHSWSSARMLEESTQVCGLESGRKVVNGNGIGSYCTSIW